MASVVLREICDPEESQKSQSPFTTKHSKRAERQLVAPSVLCLPQGRVHSRSELASETASVAQFPQTNKSSNFITLLASVFYPTQVLQHGIDITTLWHNNEEIKVKGFAPD